MFQRVVVVEPTPLVALDMAQTVSEFAPHAQVVVLDTVAQAAADPQTIDILITTRPVEELRRSRLPDDVIENGGAVLVVTDTPATAPKGWIAIVQPFTSDRLFAALQGITGGQQMPLPVDHT